MLHFQATFFRIISFFRVKLKISITAPLAPCPGSSRPIILNRDPYQADPLLSNSPPPSWKKGKYTSLWKVVCKILDERWKNFAPYGGDMSCNCLFEKLIITQVGTLGMSPGTSKRNRLRRCLSPLPFYPCYTGGRGWIVKFLLREFSCNFWFGKYVFKSFSYIRQLLKSLGKFWKIVAQKWIKVRLSNILVFFKRISDILSKSLWK